MWGGKMLFLSIVFALFLTQNESSLVDAFSLGSFSIHSTRKTCTTDKFYRNKPFTSVFSTVMKKSDTHLRMSEKIQTPSNDVVSINDDTTDSVEDHDHHKQNDEKNHNNSHETALLMTPYYDESYYESYESTMKDCLNCFPLSSQKFKEDDKKAAFEYIFTPRRVVNVDTSGHALSDALTKKEMKKQMTNQMVLFMESSKLTSDQIQICLRALHYLGDYCAKESRSKPIHVGWYKLKEMGIVPPKNLMTTYLYALSIHNENESYPVRGAGNYYNPNNIPEEVATRHDILYDPTENTVTMRVKSLVEKSNAAAAEKLIKALAIMPPAKGKKKKGNSREIRLRTCQPVLQLYCQQNDINSALKFYDFMKNTPTVYFDDEIYTTIISAIAENGHFRLDAQAIIAAVDMGYGSGPDLFDRLLSDMSMNTFEITNVCATRIRNSITIGFKGLDMARNLKEIPYDCQLMQVGDVASDDELIACRVEVDEVSARCPRTNVRLKLINLEKGDRHNVTETLLKMAAMQFESFSVKQGYTHEDPTKATEDLRQFLQWLKDRDGDPFTVIVDGANVAFFNIFRNGGFSHNQIKLVVDELEKMGENVLVVLPHKYAQEKIHMTSLRKRYYTQYLNEDELKIIDEFKSKGQLYIVPQGYLDDYYWMVSSVSDQKTSSNGVSLDVLPCNKEGRWPGTRPIIITNDLMRDHKLELLEPKLFRRWSRSHIVSYDFPDSVEGEKQEVVIQKPLCFSKEIQGNPTEIENSSSMVWHIPVSDWGKNDRLCLRIPRPLQ